MNMHFRPKIQNGPVAKRARAGSTTQPTPRATPSSPKATSSRLSSSAKSFSKPRATRSSPLATVTPVWVDVSASALARSGLAAFGLDERLQSTEVAAKEKTAARSPVLLVLIGCGVLLAGGFMFSLRDHFTAHAVGRDEVQLKSKIQQAEAERQHLDGELKRTVSPQSLERATHEGAGLAPLELERKKIISAAKQVTVAAKAKTPPAEKSQPRSGKPARP